MSVTSKTRSPLKSAIAALFSVAALCATPAHSAGTIVYCSDGSP